MGLKYGDLDKVSTEELKERHDKMTQFYGEAPMTIRDVINWRVMHAYAAKAEALAEKAGEEARTMTRLTKWIAACTVAIFLLTGVLVYFEVCHT